MLSLEGKNIFVSGAAAGIGRSISILAAKAGAKVIATDIDDVALSKLKGDNISTFILDVTDHAKVEEFFEKCVPFNGLVNVAGWVHHGRILDTSYEDWQRSFRINVDSMFYVINAALPSMLLCKSGGSIVNIASLASSLKGFKFRAAYASSKAAVIGLTKSVAVDFMEDGIRCNAVCPGTIETPSLQDRISELGKELGSLEKAREWFVDRQPMKRLGQPDEIGKLVIYLLSDDGAYATGQCHIIDGGTMS